MRRASGGRRILVALWILGLLGAGAVGFLIRQFNPDRYRSSLERKLGEMTGMEVILGKLSTGWKAGWGLEAEGLELRNRAGAVPCLSAERLSLRFNPFRFLIGKFIVNEFILTAPDILLARTPGGTNWERRSLPAREVPSPAPKAELPRWVGGFTALLSKIQVTHGTFAYRDETRSTPFELVVRDLEGDFGQEGWGGRVGGRGKGRWLHPTEPDLFWNATWASLDQELDFELGLKGEAAFKGKALLFQTPPRFKGSLKLERFEVGRLPFAVSGLVSGNVGVEGAGRNEEEIKRSLSGKGSVLIREGVIRNFNVVRSVLSRATVFPGISEVLVGSLPPSFHPVLSSRGTHFELAQVDFENQGTQTVIQSLLLRDVHFQIEAQGSVGWDGRMDLTAQLVLFDELSQFLVGRIKELGYLQNAQGRIVIPFVYRGLWSRGYPQPDLAYLAERLIVDQGSRLLEKGIEAISQWRQ